MVTKLIVASGKSAGRTISIKRNRLLIGRAEECDVRPLSEDVSRRHCEVVVGPSDTWIEDLGSRNGTFVNGVRIAEKTRLSSGDMIRVGSLELQVSCSDPAAKAGTEDDVSRWLMADEKPAGMFDTTRTVPEGDAAASKTQIVPAGADPASASGVLDSSIHATVPAGGESESSLSSPSGISSSSIHLDALKAGRGKPGALPQQPPKKAADSSRDAAAEALKKFFDNRS
jgi:pSer/pThr/pTyr-binding forkhead associated (FHA) protein